MGFIGIGVDFGYWFSQKRSLQAAADAAAIAGSYEIAENRSANTLAAAQREATSNGWLSGNGTIQVRGSKYNSSYPATGSYTTDPDAVEVTLTQTVERLFSSLFLTSDVVLNARAVGKSVPGASEACVLALGSGNPSGALTVTGSAVVTMTGCSASTNSTDTNAISSTSGLSVDCVYSSGGVWGSPVTTACSGPKTDQPSVTDPYEEVVTKPADSDFAGCVSYLAPPSTDYDIEASDGPFCEFLFEKNGETLTMEAGTYYIDRGNFVVKNGHVDATAGVTIVFGDSTGAGDCGGVEFTGNSSINITAPNSGNFSGLAFYRNADCDAGADIEIAGNNNSTVIGAVYNPSSHIRIAGTGAVGGTCLQLISDTVEITGTSDIGSNCAGRGTLAMAAGGKGALVE